MKRFVCPKCGNDVMWNDFFEEHQCLRCHWSGRNPQIKPKSFRSQVKQEKGFILLEKPKIMAFKNLFEGRCPHCDQPIYILGSETTLWLWLTGKKPRLEGFTLKL